MNYEIDKTDRQILTLLIKDARMPFTEIAKLLNVSPGTVHGRVKKMEKKRIITGATLSVNYEVVGYGLTAYIGLIVGRTIDSNSIINELIKVPEVTVANIATGQFSIFCKIRCRDAKHAKEAKEKEAKEKKNKGKTEDYGFLDGVIDGVEVTVEAIEVRSFFGFFCLSAAFSCTVDI